MSISASTLEEAFPAVKSGFTPFGEKVLIQLRVVRKKTSSGIILAEDTRSFNRDKTTLGKVIANGPLAFRNRSTGDLWPEGVWASPGDFVRAPRYGGDRFSVPDPNFPDETIDFLVVKDLEISGKVDPEVFETIDQIL